MSEIQAIQSNISIALRKGTQTTADGHTITSDDLIDRDSLRQLIKQSQAYRFLQPVRGTPPYWERTLKELLAMIQQFGIPTWFCSFSAADRRWPEIVSVILQQQGKPVPETISWKRHQEIIASNPVTAARMFEYRVETFITNVILSPAEPIGKVLNLFYRTEFQQRGWPHIHCIFWVEGAPLLNKNNDNEISIFIDKYITCRMPNEELHKELYDIVSKVQMHSPGHSETCRKGNKICRFNFPRPLSSITFIIRPKSSDDITEQDKQVAKDNIAKVRAVLQSGSWEGSVFEEAGITEDDFQDSLCTMSKRSTVILKRRPEDCWVNPYNKHLLHAWNANMDIQYILDAYSCVMYIVSYISKAERELGNLLKQAEKECKENNLDVAQEMKRLGNVYLTHREISVLEAVYRACGMPLKSCTTDVIFIPTDKDNIRITLPLQIIQNNKNDNNGQVWTKNILDRSTPIHSPSRKRYILQHELG
jgi:hypothetical protein